MQKIALEEILRDKKLENKIISEIRHGKIFVYPTDTVYGIGCNALNIKSVIRIRKAKGTDHPFSVIAPSKEWIKQNFVLKFPEYLEKLPGPVTLILKQRKTVIPWEVSKSDNVGIRIPDHAFTAVVQKSGVPFITTSANISGKKTITKIEELPKQIEIYTDFAVDDGILDNPPSRIFDLTGEEPKIIRDRA